MKNAMSVIAYFQIVLKILYINFLKQIEIYHK